MRSTVFRGFVRRFTSWKPKWDADQLIVRKTDPSVLRFGRVGLRDYKASSAEQLNIDEFEVEDEKSEENKEEKPEKIVPLKTLVAFINKQQIQAQRESIEKNGILTLRIPRATGGESELKLPVHGQSVRSFRGDADSANFIHLPKSADNLHGWEQVLLVGIGNEKSEDEIDDAVNAIRSGTWTAISSLQKIGSRHATILLPSLPLKKNTKTNLNLSQILENVCRTAILSNHTFDQYKKKQKRNLAGLSFLTDDSISEQDFKSVTTRATIIAEGTILVRQLANERSDKVNPSYMEKMAKKLVESHSDKLSFRVLNSNELKSKNFNCITAVGQGATDPPRIVVVEYKGNSSAPNDKIALVGKGITFDTGGLNLKPTGSMEQMHLDMTGSAVVLATLQVATLLKLPINLVAVLALAENALGSKSYKPHTILQTTKGSVEVGNTDAEGRLVLADAFTYVQQTDKPKIMIDVATLTGACVIALGEYAAGLFTNNDKLGEQLIKAGKTTFERTWHLPILPEHSEELKGVYTDIRSIGQRGSAGASTAAAFLKHFVEKDVAWAHLDIAGPAMYSKQRKWMPQEGTGFGVQLLTQYLENTLQK